MRKVGPGSLSPRQRELMELYIEEGRVTLAAVRMGISAGTANNYVAHILSRLGAESMGQAAVLYDRAQRAA